MTTAIGYVRTSTREQKLSPVAQRKAIQEWAKREGLTVGAWYDDTGVSGSVPVDKRPGLLAALGALRASDVDVLVVAKRDRLARDVVVAAVAERMATKNGGRIVSADGVSSEDSPEGALMRVMIDAFAAYERAIIRARTKAALAVKKAAGRRIGARAPFGWRHEGNLLVVEPEEQAVRARILELRADGLTFRQICAELEQSGAQKRGAKRWYPSAVQKICAYEPPT